MSQLRQRQPRQRDNVHLNYVRAQECCLPYCRRQAEAAHIRFGCDAIGKPHTGMGEKPDDRYVTPLCPYHHRLGIDSQHANNEREWWARTGLNPFAIAEALWIASGGAARAEAKAADPRPARVKRIKARKPKERRRKMITARRTIAGRRFNGDPIPSRPIVADAELR